MRLGILGSTRGTNVLAIIEAIKKKVLPASIELVISNKIDALILERARAHGLKAEFIDPRGLERSDYDKKITKAMIAAHVDLILLMGYMRILSKDFVQFWAYRVLNVHPSLLPAFPGKMDIQVHQAVLEAEASETGCTIHFVTDQVDEGPILLQKRCLVLPEDTVDSLKEKVQNLEALAWVEAICLMERYKNQQFPD